MIFNVKFFDWDYLKKETYFIKIQSKCQINGEDFVNFCGLLRKHEL